MEAFVFLVFINSVPLVAGNSGYLDSTGRNAPSSAELESKQSGDGLISINAGAWKCLNLESYGRLVSPARSCNGGPLISRPLGETGAVD